MKTDRDKMRLRAILMAREAVKEGLLPALDGTVKCVDCGVPATCYEHRDYYRPLLVEATCQGCNIRRGPGYPPPQKTDNAETKKPWLKGVSGDRWSNVDGGDGYSPLVCVCRIDLAEIINSIENWVDVAGNAGYWNLVRSWQAPNSHMPGSARSEYFKKHDPWGDHE